jgi:RNA polymerase sigma-70 factor (ECF subfamily)
MNSIDGLSDDLLRALYFKALRLTGDPEFARDLVQDAIERYLRCRPSDLSADRILPWLATVLRNLFLDHVRSPESRWTTLLDSHLVGEVVDDTFTGPPPTWTLIETRDVAGAVKRLPERLRRTYEMHVYQNMSYENIARSMKTTTGTVGTRLHRARHHLRAALLPTVLRE